MGAGGFAFFAGPFFWCNFLLENDMTDDRITFYVRNAKRARCNAAFFARMGEPSQAADYLADARAYMRAAREEKIKSFASDTLTLQTYLALLSLAVDDAINEWAATGPSVVNALCAEHDRVEGVLSSTRGACMQVWLALERL